MKKINVFFGVPKSEFDSFLFDNSFEFDSGLL